MALVWDEKASRTALQTSSVSHTHTLLVQTHNMTTVKEIFYSTYKQVKLKFLKTEDLENDDFKSFHSPLTMITTQIYKKYIYITLIFY